MGLYNLHKTIWKYLVIIFPETLAFSGNKWYTLSVIMFLALRGGGEVTIKRGGKII